MRSKLVAVVGTAAILAAALTACSKNTGDSANKGGNVKTEQVGAIATDPKDSLGPAAPIQGASKGGSITLYRQFDISHLDPARIYTFAGLTVGQLFLRPLTNWKVNADGTETLVGDTATVPGIDVNKDCKTWKFPIKQGLKFEDGSPITAHDIAYGIARSFDLDLNSGPLYIQQWLANADAFDKVWDFKTNKTSLPPGLTVPDDHTLQMQFQEPHCDLPFAASLPETAPVPSAKDTGVDYDKHPVASGPYKIASYTVGQSLNFDRNPNYEPNTDAVRHNYPDSYVVNIGKDPVAQTNLLISDTNGADTAIGLSGVDASLINKVEGDASLASRKLEIATADTERIDINNNRVTDLSVRQALNYAIDRQDLIKVVGGPTQATPATTLLPKQALGYEGYDAYPAGDTGNIDKAKELLAGKHPNLVFAINADGSGDDVAAQIKNNLEKAGFVITLRKVSADSIGAEQKKPTNQWDMYLNDWSYDWPSGSSVIPPLYDGSTIKSANNTNECYLNAPDVNSEVKRILALPAAQQGPEWSKLDKLIMTKYAPVVPLWYSNGYYLVGSKIGGITLSSVFGGFPLYNNAYVKQV